MYAKKFEEFEWRDIKKLKEEVEKQKARVESLQTEKRWIKNSHSANDLCDKTNRLDRSDSGIDRQSLLMDGHNNSSGYSSHNNTANSTGNNAGGNITSNSISGINNIGILSQGLSSTTESLGNLSLSFYGRDRSPNDIRKIIEITSLIRNIEQQLHSGVFPGPENLADLNNAKHSIPTTFSSLRSLPRCTPYNYYDSMEMLYNNQNIPTGSGGHYHGYYGPNSASGPNQPMSHPLLMPSAILIEHDRINKHLSQLNSQLYHLENVRIPALLTGISNDKLKKNIEDYHRLKTLLSELATSGSCSSSSMINVVKQLEPIASTVEEYFKLNQDVKNIQKQINAAIYRRNILETKRHKFGQQAPPSMTSIGGHLTGHCRSRGPTDHLPQSASWDQPSSTLGNALFDCANIYSPNYVATNLGCCMSGVGPQSNIGASLQQIKKELLHQYDNNNNNNNNNNNSNNNNSSTKTCAIPTTSWPDFNGDGILEDAPPSFDEYLEMKMNQGSCSNSNNNGGGGTSSCHNNYNTLTSSNTLGNHSRTLCHEYVNQNVLMQRDNNHQQTIEVSLSVFPSEGIVMVQGRNFVLNQPLLLNRQYRARILQLNGEGSDWNNLSITDEEGCAVSITPNILLPIKWNFLNSHHLSLLLELQLLDKGSPCSSYCYLFNILPHNTLRNIKIPMHVVHHKVTEDLEMRSKTGTFNLTPYSAVYPRSLENYHLMEFTKPSDPSSNYLYNNIRRSQTYSHDHQHYGNIECYYQPNISNNNSNNANLPNSNYPLVNEEHSSITNQQQIPPCCSPGSALRPPSHPAPPQQTNSSSYGHTLAPRCTLTTPSNCNTPIAMSGNRFPHRSTSSGSSDPTKLNTGNTNINDTHQQPIETNSLFDSSSGANAASCSSTNSSFKRQSPFRQPIRMKRAPSILDFKCSNMTIEGLYEDSQIRELWNLLLNLHLSISSCITREEALLEFTYFKSKCPSHLMKLYDYFVDTIFNTDNSDVR